MDLVIVRENTEGLYSGIENQVTDGVVMSMKVATETACTRIARWAFRYAARRGRRKVTVFHKANIMKMTDGLFLRCARKVHDEEFPDIEYQELIIDAGCMKLVQDPTQFDVLLLENLYGDVVSDLCAGLVGGLGVVPGANLGDELAVFEAVHGSAPDIAGQGIANPLALLMSGVMMLNHLAETRDDPRCRERRRADQGGLQPRAGRRPEDPRPRRHARHRGIHRGRDRAARVGASSFWIRPARLTRLHKTVCVKQCDKLLTDKAIPIVVVTINLDGRTRRGGSADRDLRPASVRSVASRRGQTRHAELEHGDSRARLCAGPQSCASNSVTGWGREKDHSASKSRTSTLSQSSNKAISAAASPPAWKPWRPWPAARICRRCRRCRGRGGTSRWPQWPSDWPSSRSSR